MKKTVLITGGSGLLGLNWALGLRDRYAVTLALHERAVGPVGVDTRRIDLDSVAGLARALENAQPHVVVHTVALTDVDECDRKPEAAWHVNVQLAANVALACAKLQLPLVHVSTDHLFRGDASFLDERHPTEPVNVYGRTKAEAEARVLEAHPQALVIRTNFYGWGPRYRRSFSDVIIGALRSGNRVTLFTDVLYTPIIADAVARTAHNLIDRGAGGIFHVTGDDRISKYEFGLKLADQFDLDAGLISPGLLSEAALPVPRPRDMSLSNKKVRDSLGGRGLGGVDEHVSLLFRQEQQGLARELQSL